MRFVCFLLLFLFVAQPCIGDDENSYIETSLASLPDHGVAGPYVGIISDQLIVAGGSWFPDGSTGEKKYTDRILSYNFVSKSWHAIGTLPERRAHGAAVVNGNALICIGGENKSGAVAAVWRLTIADNLAVVDSLSDLPKPLSFLAGTIAHGTIYTAGSKGSSGGADDFLSLSPGDPNWHALAPLPGRPRFGCNLITQHDGEFTALYLIGGKSDQTYLKDGFKYDIKKAMWKPIADMPRPALVAPCIAIGQSDILLFSGSDGIDAPRWRELGPDFHFTKEILSYNTITDRWTKRGNLNVGIASTTPVVYNGQIFLPSGEVRPTVRTTQFSVLKKKPSTKTLQMLDYITLLAYLLFIVAIGVYVGRKNKTTDDYFLGGNRLPWWAIGLSLLATQVSSIGFMAIPAKTFATDWRYFVSIVTWFVTVPIVVRYFIPKFRSMGLTSAYEYLEHHFDIRLRWIASAAYSLMQLGRMAFVLFLPALAISAVTGIDPFIAIIIMGILATVYTVVGGIEAVVWTDVAQAAVLFGGTLFCIVSVFWQLDTGWSQTTGILQSNNKIKLIDLGFSPNEAVLWVVLLGSFMSRLGGLVSDQSLVQRYLSAKSTSHAKRALWLDVAVSIPWAIIIYGLGTALFLFYKANPVAMPPGASTIEIVPQFIIQQLPAGISGLVIAAILAAAMSSLDSAMHSVSTIWTTDWYSRFFPETTDAQRLKFAKRLIVLLGIFAIGAALVLASTDIRSMWDLFFKVAGSCGGGLAGVFLLARFMPRATAIAALVGMIASFGVLILCWQYNLVHPLLYTAVGVLVVFVVGIVFPKKPI